MKSSQRIYENPSIWSSAYAPEQQFAQYDECYGPFLPAETVEIADIGCGRCEWLLWLQSKGYTHLTGLDYSANALEQGKVESGISICHGYALDFLREAPGRFDLLHAKDIVEHMTVDELVDFLDAAQAALKPGGELWILTYNAQAPFSNATRYGDPTHEIGLTPSSLFKLLSTCGFDRIRVRGIHHTPPTLKGWIRRFLWRSMTPIFQTILKASHGATKTEGVESLSTDPDIFGMAQRPIMP